MGDIKSRIINKILQIVCSMLGGFWLAVETSFDFFIPCLLAVVLDVITAYLLERRLHVKYPDKCDGKFKSKYKLKILITMIVIWICIILANYIDIQVRCAGDNLAVRYTLGLFFFYEGWSCLENWSSENDEPLAKALQRIMVNKAERHFDVKLDDIFFREDGNKTKP